MPGGSSLARLLAEHRGRRNGSALPPLCEKQILAWADAHFARTGDWPHVRSGPIREAPAETWNGINHALLRGSRGLPARMSLARLLDLRRGTHLAHFSTPLDVETILAWADAYHARHGKWPSLRSGRIDASPGEAWSAVNAALCGGCRGLAGGSSLARLLVERRGARDRRAFPALSVTDILRWADAFHVRYGLWPTRDSGAVDDAAGETWGALDRALRTGRRGLPGGETLSALLDRCRRRVGPKDAASGLLTR